MAGQKQKTVRPRRQWTAKWIFCFAGLVLGLVGAFLVSSPKLNLRRVPVAPGEQTVAGIEKGVVAAYGGSPTCKSCHEEAYALWQHSHHAMAERDISLEIDSVAFQSHFRFRHGTNQDWVQTTGSALEIVTTGLDGKHQAFRPERVLAVNPLRQFLIPAAGGRHQVTELAYDPNHPDWFNVYGEDNRRPGEWGHWTGRGMTWNSMCAACHNTRVQKNYDYATDIYRTTMAERGVGCEACHGPMADHNAWQARNPNQTGDPTIRKQSRDQMLWTCGSCHSRRAELTDGFQPGHNYFDHYALSIPDETDLFYPDGQIRDEDFELAPFLGSRMHASGVRCIDCHEPHGGKVRIAGNNLCMVCHAAPAPPAPKIDPATHSHHAVGSRGDNCVDCHMPQTVYMQRDARHDHGFSIPDPLLTKEFGIPNACNRCHDDRDADWALQAVQKWYGYRMHRATRARAQLIARAKQGDNSVKPELLTYFASETNSFWRAVAAGFLKRWSHDESVRRALLQGVVDTNGLVRSVSLRSLEGFVASDTGVESAFRSRLDDAERGVRIDAAWGLRTIIDTNSRAGTDLLKYLDHVSDQPSGALQAGVFRLDRGDPKTAMHYFRRALLWDTNSAALHHALAIGLSIEGNPHQAVTALRDACRLAPDDPEYRYKLALALNESGNQAEARDCLEQAVKIDPNFSRAWYNLGLAYNSAGQTDKSLDALLRAEALEPKSGHIPYARATILARVGRIAEAREAVSRALELEPNSIQAQQLIQTLGR